MDSEYCARRYYRISKLDRNCRWFENYLRASLHDAQYSYDIANAKQSADSSQKYKLLSYAVGSKSWINKSLYKDAYS